MESHMLLIVSHNYKRLVIMVKYKNVSTRLFLINHYLDYSYLLLVLSFMLSN